MQKFRAKIKKKNADKLIFLGTTDEGSRIQQTSLEGEKRAVECHLILVVVL